MNALRSDIQHTAEKAVLGLSQTERLALGTEILTRITDPQQFMSMRLAAWMISERADLLADVALHQTPGAEPRAVLQLEATTHELDKLKERPRAGRLRAAYKTLRQAERQFSESVWGDLLGGICLMILAFGAVVVAGVLQ